MAASQAGLQVKKAEAYQMGETRKVQAEAAVLEAEHLARAKAALAEAQRIEAERRAAFEAPAKADKAKIEVDAAAEAAKRRIEAEGEAAAIFAKLEAEARGQFEILSKKGQGLHQIIEACGGAEQAFQLLMLEHFDHLVEASAKAISNIKFDKVVVWEGNAANGQSATANWLHNMSRTLPPMMQVMRDIGGVEIPETLATLAGVQRKPATDGHTVGEAPTPAHPRRKFASAAVPPTAPQRQDRDVKVARMTATVYKSSAPFDESRIRAAAVYCSDGRFGEQFDDFLHNGLKLPRCDRLAVPGGAASLAGHFLGPPRGRRPR